MARRTAEMEEITLTLGGRQCRIIIGQGILATAGGLLHGGDAGRRYAVITNPAVNALYGAALSRSMNASGLDHEVLEIADAEASKSLGGAEWLYGQLSELKFDRDSRIIGLGGGVVGDLAGFVAATYMRGIDIIQIPTTLLAQADSAIGGKTALNLPGGKNLVGAFHQPLFVISDVSVLASLPDAEYASGLAEVVKYGMACDAGLFGRLETDASLIKTRDGAALARIVRDCSAIKARIVERDEKDLGERLLLNYGHTLGHALEAATGYTRYRHGEAVALGMVFAARLSTSLGLLPQGDLDRLEGLMRALCLPTGIVKGPDPGTLLELMAADKKSRKGEPRLVLPTAVGRAEVRADIDNLAILETLGGMT